MPRVLVVDDELDARELLQVFIVARGYEVMTASDPTSSSWICACPR
jgi:DNA-binding response OmpR family regulator